MNRQEAIDWLRSLRGPWLGDGFKAVHRDELIAALEEPAPVLAPYRTLSDEDGHRYKVPEDRAQAFKAGINRICEQTPGTEPWHDACADFNNAFERYRV